MQHFTDHDSICIHCGMDTCDWPRGERLPPCPVWQEDIRARNVKRFEQNTDDALDALWDERVPLG